ncbi:uncharacterized protein LOC135383818 [Ornithodoros turicata]|uniref:uncharacterized protein LOC135383818 n=1 Tax=Ornithodoros turicata TaxID=34597 RepID=UPI003139B973
MDEAPPFHGAFTKDFLYELHRHQPHRFRFMTKFNAKSASWKDFELVVLDGELRDFARCVHCKNFVSYSSKKGTGSMLRHRCHAKEVYFTEEQNRFREMELYLRGTAPHQLTFQGIANNSTTFLPRIKVEVPDTAVSPEARGIDLSDEAPLDARLRPSVDVDHHCKNSQPSLHTNGEVEEIVASVELADDSNCLPDEEDRVPPGQAFVQHELAELQRIHAEEEHRLKVELLKKQHSVADLQRRYWRLKLKLLSQKSLNSEKTANDESESD